MPRRTQQERSETTRAALLAAGRELFGRHGVAAVSAEQLVAHAGVTRGALYHHFQDKNHLFEAVLDTLNAELAAELTACIDAAPTAAEGLLRGLRRFLDVCERPEVRQLALVDGPAVLGWDAARGIEHRHALGALAARLESLSDQGLPLERPDVVAQLVYSMLCEGAHMVAGADDPAAMRERVEATLVDVVGAIGRVGTDA